MRSGRTTKILDQYACKLVLERGSSQIGSLTRPGETGQVGLVDTEAIDLQLIPVVT